MGGSKKKICISVIYLAVISAVIIFCCLTVLDRSKAWFANSTEVDADGMGITLCYDSTINIENISIYKVAENDNSATLYRDPSDIDLAEILTLDAYDTIFEEKREHTPIIIKTTLDNFKNGDEAADIAVTVSLGDTTGYTMMNGDKAVLMPYISNFINICCSTEPVLSDADKAPEDYYPYARDLFFNSPVISPNAQTFVSYTGTGSDTSTGQKSDTMIFIITKPEGQSTLDVYFMFSYDENLMARFIDDNEEGGVLDGYFEFGSAENEFLKDIAKISFTEVKNEAN